MGAYADWDLRRLITQVQCSVDRIEAKLDDLGASMTEQSEAVANLTTAVQGVASRVADDVAHLQELLSQALDAVATAQANDATDTAAIAELNTTVDSLRADAADTVGRINEATDSLSSIDPLSDFPAPPEPTPEPQPEPTPEA